MAKTRNDIQPLAGQVELGDAIDSGDVDSNITNAVKREKLDIPDVRNLSDALDGKSNVGHKHTSLDISDFNDAVDKNYTVVKNKADIERLASKEHEHNNLQALSNVRMDGAGNKYLADNGKYKEVLVKWGEIQGDIGLQNDLQNELDKTYKKIEHVDHREDDSVGCSPIVLRPDGYIDKTLIDPEAIDPIGIPVGNHDPSAGTEYPDNSSEPVGSYWIVNKLDNPSGSDGRGDYYTFVTGDLAGETIHIGEFMLTTKEGWSIVSNNRDDSIYYKRDGSVALTGDLAGGGNKGRNFTKGTDPNDLVTVEQLNDYGIGGTWGYIQGDIESQQDLQDQFTEYFKKSDHKSKPSDDWINDIGAPIVLGPDGKIDPDFMEIKIFNFKDNFTPDVNAGIEYPPGKWEAGDYWIIEGVGDHTTDGYTFQTGDLAGKKVFDDDMLVKAYDSAENPDNWALIKVSLDPTHYLRVDGLNSMKSHLNGGGYRAIDFSDGINESDLVTRRQLDLAEKAAEWGTITGDISIQADLWGELQNRWKKSQHIRTSDDPEIATGRPIELNEWKRIDTSLLEISMIKIVGHHTPCCGTEDKEYPQYTGGETGHTWVVAYLGLDQQGDYIHYEFQAGDLAGKECRDGDLMILAIHEDGTPEWILHEVQNDPNAYLRVDGTNPMRANMNIGGYRITNMMPGQVDSDGATVGQLIDVAGAVMLPPVIIEPIDGQADYSGPIKTDPLQTTELWDGSHDASDWELSDTEDFSNIIDSSYDDTTNLIEWQPSAIPGNTLLYARVRFHSGNHISHWSHTRKFYSPGIFVETPTVTVEGEPDNVQETPTITGSAFNVIGGSDTHASTTWRIEDVNGTVVWESVDDITNLVSITVPAGILVSNTEYTAKVAYKGTQYVSGYGEKDFKTAVSFVYIETPTVTIEGEPDSVPESPWIYGSTFTVVGGSDTHESTTWRVVKTSDDSVVWESVYDTTNLEQIQIPSNTLEILTEYRFEVVYNGATYTSQTGSKIATTKDVFDPRSLVQWIDHVASGNNFAQFNGRLYVGGLTTYKNDAGAYVIDIERDPTVYLNASHASTNLDIASEDLRVYLWDGIVYNQDSNVILQEYTYPFFINDDAFIAKDNYTYPNTIYCVSDGTNITSTIISGRQESLSDVSVGNDIVVCLRGDNDRLYVTYLGLSDGVYDDYTFIIEGGTNWQTKKYAYVSPGDKYFIAYKDTQAVIINMETEAVEKTLGKSSGTGFSINDDGSYTSYTVVSSNDHTIEIKDYDKDDTLLYTQIIDVGISLAGTFIPDIKRITDTDYRMVVSSNDYGPVSIIIRKV